jgi:putative tryptophan/tyrosine transport system substrate-binding protein
MNRRRFIAGLGGLVTSSLGVQAQQVEQVRRIGVLGDYAKDDPEAHKREEALERGLREFGWRDGRNLRIEYRSGGGDSKRIQRFASELVALMPDLIVTSGTPATEAVRRETDKIPIVFANVADPVASGLVASLSRPEGNITGFANYEYSLGGKWLGLLQEAAPSLKRLLFLLNPANVSAGVLSGSMAAAASMTGINVITVEVRNAKMIENEIMAFSKEGTGGLMVAPDGGIAAHRELIISMAANRQLPSIYPFQFYATAGGLMSYGVDLYDIFGRTAQYANRIFKGGRPSELPVQLPIKFELIINLKTARVLGLEVPQTLLARADKVIE